MPKSDAQATIESGILCALAETSPITHLTIDKSRPVVDALMKELFHPSTAWALGEYLREIGVATA